MVGEEEEVVVEEEEDGDEDEEEDEGAEDVKEEETAAGCLASLRQMKRESCECGTFEMRMNSSSLSS